jgi:hypothetical protein
MGDTNVETVRRHHFNFEFEDDEQIVDRCGSRPSFTTERPKARAIALGPNRTSAA